MSDDNSSTGSQRPSDQPRPTKNIRGLHIAAGGVVFAFLPLLITLVGSIFVDDAFNEGKSTLGTLPWLTILTMPIGAITVVVGMVVGLANVTRRNQ